MVKLYCHEKASRFKLCTKFLRHNPILRQRFGLGRSAEYQPAHTTAEKRKRSDPCDSDSVELKIAIPLSVFWFTLEQKVPYVSDSVASVKSVWV